MPLDDRGTLIRKHFLQLDGLGVPDLHFFGDNLHILAGPAMVLNGDIRVSKWLAARPSLAANRDPVRFEEALTESVPLQHGRGVDRADAICDLRSASCRRLWLGARPVGLFCTTRRAPTVRMASTLSTVTCCTATECLQHRVSRLVMAGDLPIDPGSSLQLPRACSQGSGRRHPNCHRDRCTPTLPRPTR